MIEPLFVRTVGENRLLSAGDRVLVAVSGGGDSVALLRLLHAHAGRLGIELAVAHVNHALRGEESDRDEQFVRDLAATLGLACDVQVASPDGRGEASLRATRHRLLRESAARSGSSRIALGHTMDDQAETVLLRLLRGAGRRGLSGMLLSGPGPLVRPLLGMRRGDLRAWLREIGQPFRDDASNQEPRYVRNRVRGEVIPLLEEIRPASVPALARAAELLREEDRFLDDLARGWIAACAPGGTPAGVSVPAEPFSRLAPILARRVLRLLVARVGGDPRAPSLAAIRGVLRLAVSGLPGEGRRLAGGLRVSREEAAGAGGAEGGLLTIHRSAEGPGINAPRNRAPSWSVELQVPGRVTLPGGEPPETIEARLEEWEGTAVADGKEAVHLDAESLGSTLVVRTRRPGDRFHPLGAPGSCRLKEFLIDRKVPRARRDLIPLVVGPRGIAWIVGLRAGDPYRITERTRRVAILSRLR